MFKRISPASVIAGIALFVALGGTGMAATGFRITSIHQIAPQVRHQLKGQPNYYSATAQSPLCARSTPSCPSTADLAARCNPGDPVVTGGFYGTNEAVTTDDVALVTMVHGTITHGWAISAHLERGHATGHVYAHALCVRS